MLLLEGDVQQYAVCGVYKLFNEATGDSYLASSTNVLEAVVRLIGDLKTNKKLSKLDELIRVGTVKLAIIETMPYNSTQAQLRAKLAFWCDQYTKDNKRLINDYRGLIYKVKTYIGQDFRVYVELSDKSCNKKWIIGVFRNVFQADRFIETLPTPLAPGIYAQNQMTIKFYKRQGIDIRTK